VHGHAHPHVPQHGAVLDIGGDVGAVMVLVGPDLDGAEIELYDEHGTYVMHTEVHVREVMGQARYAGLFPAVAQGTYLLETTDGAPRERVVVTGGQVARVNRA
jgi:sugar (pentulose or hexulose) kinase